MGDGMHHDERPRAGENAADDWTTADPDHVDAVADEITTLSAHIHAATHRLLTLRTSSWT